MDLLARLATWVEVDLDAVSRNYRRVRSILNPSTRFLAMVKADAAGHGSIAVSRTLLEEGADALGVATVLEGIELRQAGIEAPILVATGNLPSQSGAVARNRLTPALFDMEAALALSAIASSLGLNVKVHIKIDTGMGRWGIACGNAYDFVEAVSKLPGLVVEGVFSHFACAEERDHGFTEHQFSRFLEVMRSLNDGGYQIPIRHVAASAAILNFPHMHLDMVRCSSLLHGLYPSEHVSRQVSVESTFALKSRVVQIKRIGQGDSVSYGRRFVASKPTLVGVVPVGFTDGLNRMLSNGWDVLVGGRRAPIIGLICMDACMVDVTGIPGVSKGDEVVIIGTQGNEAITPSEMAARTGATQAGLLSQINKRIPRIYFQGGTIRGDALSLGRTSVGGIL